MDKQLTGLDSSGPRTILHLEPVTACGRSHDTCPWAKKTLGLVSCEAPLIDYQLCMEKGDEEDE